MTGNQIAYQRNVETERHNLVTEEQTYIALAETHRHNVETEKLGWANVSLGYANVNLGYARLDEERRHNEASEQLGWANVYTTRTHNERMERLEANKQSHQRKKDSADNPWLYRMYNGSDTMYRQMWWSRALGFDNGSLGTFANNLANNFVSGALNRMSSSAHEMLPYLMALG